MTIRLAGPSWRNGFWPVSGAHVVELLGKLQQLAGWAGHCSVMHPAGRHGADLVLSRTADSTRSLRKKSPIDTPHTPPAGFSARFRAKRINPSLFDCGDGRVGDPRRAVPIRAGRMTTIRWGPQSLTNAPSIPNQDRKAGLRLEMASLGFTCIWSYKFRRIRLDL